MIKVHFFAALKQYFEEDTQVEYIQDETVQAFLQRLSQLYPKASEALGKCRVAINEEFVPLTASIQSQADIFVIPPSSGG